MKIMNKKTLSWLTKTTPIATSLLLLSGCIIHVSSANAEVQQQQKLVLSSAQLKALVIDADAGSMHIKGDENVNEISVAATVYTNEEQNNYTLTLMPEDDKAVLIAKHYNKALGVQIYSGDSPTIDLTITIPSHFNLDIDDDSGDINITGVQGNIDIDDDSGSITIAQGHNITIDDDSGDIDLQKVTGNVIINDDSGSINIDDVQGDLSIEDDSGDITLANIIGPVEIDDNSGNITATALGNNLIIEDESGDIHVEHVNGLVTIEDGSGDIRVNHAKGLTITDAGSGELSIDNINGPVKLD